MRRFSIAGLMFAVTVAGLAVAALREATDVWAGGMLLVTLAVLSCSAFGVAYRRGPARAGWFGFAVFGWGYLALALGPWWSPQRSFVLPTDRALEELHARLHPDPSASGIATRLRTRVSQGSGPAELVVKTGPSTAWPSVITSVSNSSSPGRKFIVIRSAHEEFRRIGHCLFALLSGLCGSFVARWFQRRAGDAARGEGLSS